MAKARKKNNNVAKKEILQSTKKYSLIQKALGFAELCRPIEWTKSLLNMVLATLIVYYVYIISLGFGLQISIGLFVAGFFSVAFLWSGLYTLNDYTDWRIDALHERKKFRPIPSGKVTPLQGFSFSLLLILISIIIPLALGNFLLLICVLAMITNQLLYTTKPFRLKSRKIFDIISGGMVNPFFRYFSGIVLFVPAIVLVSNPIPILPIIFVIGMQFGGYSLYRMFSIKYDKKVKMKSSVALVSPKKMQAISYGVMGIGALSYLGLLINGATFRAEWLGYLPPQYIGAIIIALLFSPLLIGSIKNPQKADMKKSYRSLYIANTAFIIGHLVIFFLFH